VLIPVLAPQTSRHANDEVRLGRMTEWCETPDGDVVPVGQKMLLADGEDVSILEVRRLEIAAAEPVGESHAIA
jgi:protein involved in temperature-dependent protein secretion